jgi:hypothetical protein
LGLTFQLLQLLVQLSDALLVREASRRRFLLFLMKLNFQRSLLLRQVLKLGFLFVTPCLFGRFINMIMGYKALI